MRAGELVTIASTSARRGAPLETVASPPSPAGSVAEASAFGTAELAICIACCAAGSPFATQGNTDGFSSVQFASPSGNPLYTSQTTTNAMNTSCRAATFIQYAFDNYTASHTLPMGVMGQSEGSSEVLYSMIDYNLGAETTAIMLSAASPFGDLFNGCTTNATRTFTAQALAAKTSQTRAFSLGG